MTDRPGTGPNDLELVERFRGGDKSAFEELVVRYQKRVYNLAFRLTGLPNEAQELTQEVFIKIFEKAHTFRGDSAFSTWLYQIASNHAKNKLKYLKRRHYYSSESMDQPIDGEDGEMERQYPCANPSPEDEMGSAQVRRVVQEKLAELPEDQRLVIALRDIEGMDYDEIAQITGLAIGTVKSRIHRGRLELKRKLGFLWAEGGV